MTAVVFIHGLWLHATSWDPWVGLFQDRGYEAIAPEWPGVPATVAEARADPSAGGGYGITAIADHLAGIVEALPAPPVVIGHSFGGLLAQNLLGRGVASAAVAIDPAPIKGVYYLPPSALRVASIALRKPANRNGTVALTREQFRYGFGNALSEQESDELFERWAIPSTGRPLFEAAAANFSPRSPAKVSTGALRGPLLITAGGLDHTVPAAVSRATARVQRRGGAVTDVLPFPTRGHSLTIDNGWREVADAVLDWVDKRSPTP
jgi:pimeloyl-ACP methyl ester carboxylesterase